MTVEDILRVHFLKVRCSAMVFACVKTSLCSICALLNQVISC